ncbi:hypothetical protein P7K49_021802 [Saguinus oedipus]|uniref:protein-tyrosine-phosphatase n=1 Tax=Saguinus oedipus TaxID=9490 RepID=A0ABQ9UTN6_SAGOE|nr:hypothetical protein P7K49_021802 [Saguinus oedipus]
MPGSCAQPLIQGIQVLLQGKVAELRAAMTEDFSLGVALEPMIVQQHLNKNLVGLMEHLRQLPVALHFSGHWPSPVFDIKAVSISPTNVILTWNSSDPAASEYKCAVKSEMEKETISVVHHRWCNITDLHPATSYVFAITPGIDNKTWGDPKVVNVITGKMIGSQGGCDLRGWSRPWVPELLEATDLEPIPVSNLSVVNTDLRKVTLTWSNDNDTASCRLLLESLGSHEASIQDLVANISDLKPGFKYSINPYHLKPNETKGASLSTKGGLNANDTEGSQAGSPTAPVHQEFPSSGQQSRVTEVLLVGLKPGTRYNATVYSQAANGTEGQPQTKEFRTSLPLYAPQVFDITVVNISATSLILTWKINDSDPSSVYTYKIDVVGEMHSFNGIFGEPHAIISGLRSSTFYSIRVRPFLDGTEGTPGFLQVYTREFMRSSRSPFLLSCYMPGPDAGPPGPVSDFRVTMVSTREIGLAWSSNDTESFKMCITQEGAGKSWVETTTNRSITIGGLFPGAKYCFEIFPQGPNGTEGASQTVCNRTGSASKLRDLLKGIPQMKCTPSAVSDIRVVDVTTTEMELEWQNPDNASEYVYHLVIEPQHGSNPTSTSDKVITLRGLIPGTLYNITISPEVEHVWGHSTSIAQYTRPSNVSNIDVSTNTTEATLSWQNFDDASPTYSYRLLIVKFGDASNATLVTDVGITEATVTELMPGSSYTVEIFAQVGGVMESLEPGRKSFCTDPASVASFDCEVVPKEPALVLRWTCPPGANAGFELEVSSGAWDNATQLESCSSENDTEYRTEVTYLNFSTSYNISITTVSCGKMAAPTQNTCTTGITDPPPPDESPNITSVSHNSVKVKFSGFEASHGPIKAYAVILTTGEAGHPSADVLKYTYEDFKKGASDTYVTYLVRTEEKGRSQSLSEVLKYEIDVGNESTTLGYYNGKLEPLGSYRACVAGFTNITFHPQNNGLIDGAESYVSFSRYSEAVSLPQDPGRASTTVLALVLWCFAPSGHRRPAAYMPPSDLQEGCCAQLSSPRS